MRVGVNARWGEVSYEGRRKSGANYRTCKPLHAGKYEADEEAPTLFTTSAIASPDTMLYDEPKLPLPQ